MAEQISEYMSEHIPGPRLKLVHMSQRMSDRNYPGKRPQTEAPASTKEEKVKVDGSSRESSARESE